jgi:NAD(P)-dependent dehydrogenase (short-subunit alcohol dehydrogenase family)
MEQLAVVTGANRGIGKAVAERLRGVGFRVIATARHVDQARALGKELDVEPAVLDVTDEASILELLERLDGVGLDVLVNNAGIALDGFDENVAHRTLATNFFGARNMTEAFLPRMAAGARVVMVSSGYGAVSHLRDPIRSTLARLELEEPNLLELAEAYPLEVARGVHETRGWPSNAYKVSKALLNAYTRLLANRLRSDPRGILVNAVCPGWVRTDMGGSSAPRSVDEGALGIVWAAQLPPGGPSGGFFRDGRAVEW